MTRAEIQALADGPLLSATHHAAAGCGPTRTRRGYAADPGTGPSGETCGSCRHLARHRGCAKVYLKCELMRVIWTGGGGTDVKARSPACQRWQNRSPAPP